MFSFLFVLFFSVFCFGFSFVVMAYFRRQSFSRSMSQWWWWWSVKTFFEIFIMTLAWVVCYGWGFSFLFLFFLLLMLLLSVLLLFFCWNLFWHFNLWSYYENSFVFLVVLVRLLSIIDLKKKKRITLPREGDFIDDFSFFKWIMHHNTTVV